jgi:hypothetical protein
MIRFSSAARFALVGLLLAAAPAMAASKPKPVHAAKAAQPAVVVSEDWVREAPPGMEMNGGYMTLTNQGKHALVLQHITSPLYHDVQMHTLVKQGNEVGMKEMKTVTIPAGGKFEFVPGGNHLMLMGPKKSLKRGDKVPLTLDFGRDGKLTVNPEVKNPSADDSDKH